MEHLIEAVVNAAVVVGGLLYGFRRLEQRIGTLIQFEQVKEVRRAASGEAFSSKAGRQLLRDRLARRLAEVQRRDDSVESSPVSPS